MRVCRHALLVATAGNLPWEPLQRICDDLTDEHVEVVGCVLNRFRQLLPAWVHELLR
jgi:hypothetical protein